MDFFNKLVVKIILFSAIIFTVSIGVYMTFFIQSELVREANVILTNGLIFSELSAPVLYQDYLTSSARGFPRFQDIAQERLQKNQNIIQVMLLAVNGKIIFDSDDFSSDIVSGRTGTSAERFIDDKETGFLLQQGSVQSRDLIVNKERVTEIVVPIAETGGGHVFSMKYLLSYHSLESRRLEIYRETIIGFLPLLLLTIGSSVFLAFSITRPIQRLYHATEKIQKGDLAVQVAVKSHDEIGKLTAAFNQMVTSLAGSQQKLKEYSQTLEGQVAQRTQQLQGKLIELEKMNKFMVGRELKMAELKKEIEELKKKIVV